MVPSKRNYREYNLDNILDMTPEQFMELLNNEIYSLVLVYRLLELKSNFEDIEEYMYCAKIRDWFDLNNIHFNVED
jgi:hypothetical protein